MNLIIYSNLISYNIILLSSIIAISSTNIFIIWVSLELNLFFFIPLLMDNTSPNESETSINYFLAQALGSSIFIISNTINITTHLFSNLSFILLAISILLNIGAAPFHYWYPICIEIISWINCFLLSTWQNLAPITVILFILSNTNNFTLFFYIIILSNALVGGLMGLSLTSINNIIAYSSITHISWILSSLITHTLYLSILYFLVYSAITMPLFLLFYISSSNNIYDLSYNNNSSITTTTTMATLLMSLGGLPPLTGFVPNLLILNTITSYSSILIIILIFGSIINLFFYINLSFNILISHQESTNHLPHNNTSLIMSSILAINLIALPIINT